MMRSIEQPVTASDGRNEDIIIIGFVMCFIIITLSVFRNPLEL
jgi:hypothetical protein